MLKSQRTNTFDTLGNMMAHYDEETRDEISTGEWIASTILAHLPLIGIIILLFWAFGGGTSPTKANWAKAQLILAVSLLVLAAVFFPDLFAILLLLTQFCLIWH